MLLKSPGYFPSLPPLIPAAFGQQFLLCNFARNESGRGNSHTLSSGTDRECGANSYTANTLLLVVAWEGVAWEGVAWDGVWVGADSHPPDVTLAWAHLLPSSRRQRHFLMRFSTTSVVVVDDCSEQPVGGNFPSLPSSPHHEQVTQAAPQLIQGQAEVRVRSWCWKVR